MTVADYFEKNRYVYLSNVLSKDDCEQLTKYMWDMKEKNQLVQDEQCPLSYSIYGSEIFDGILDKLCEPLSNQLGVELLPAYTYARLYQPGEELVRHKDRESCEISGTMTLGFDPGSGIWPIYFGRNDEDTNGMQFEIGTGDLVMYRGNELYHWRPKYKGKWQVQVFFHYVDKNGPHKSFAFDGRKQLGVDKSADNMAKPDTVDIDSLKAKVQAAQSNTKVDEGTEQPDHPFRTDLVNGMLGIRTGDGILPGFCSYRSDFMPQLTFTKEECEKIIKIADNQYAHKASVGADQDSKVDRRIRSVDNYTIRMNQDNWWIFEKIAAAVGTANADFYRYDLYGITHELQLLHYKAVDNDHYHWHADVGPGSSSFRKISVSIPLSDPNSYKGGDLELNDNGREVTAPREQGAINMFPSYQIHRVAPVTEGERWVIVIWINGPRFK